MEVDVIDIYAIDIIDTPRYLTIEQSFETGHTYNSSNKINLKKSNNKSNKKSNNNNVISKRLTTNCIFTCCFCVRCGAICKSSSGPRHLVKHYTLPSIFSYSQTFALLTLLYYCNYILFMRILKDSPI